MSQHAIGRSSLAGALAIGLSLAGGCSLRSDRPMANPEPVLGFAGVLQDTVELDSAEILAFEPNGPYGPAILVTSGDGVTMLNLERFQDRVVVTSTIVFSLGLQPGEEVTSVATDPAGRGFAAAAVLPADAESSPGRVVLFEQLVGDVIAEASTGYHPDCVVISPDGQWLVTADEGEGTGPADRPGGITIVSLDKVTRDAIPRRLRSSTITLHDEPGIEPEYLAADNNGVWVAFQESSELRRHEFGSDEHWSAQARLDARQVVLDTNDRDGVISPVDRVLALPQPDTIVRISTPAGDRLVAANEGDPRVGEDERFAKLDSNSPTPRLEVGVIPETPGYLAAFGTRDLSIHDPETGSLLSTTGSQIEEAARDIARLRIERGDPEAEADLDKRSDQRGPEPEGLAAMNFAGRSLVFVGLERADAVVIFDLTDPEKPRRVGVIDLQGAPIPGDAPEGLLSFEFENNAYLAVASEASGTVHVYKIVTENR